MDLANRGSVYGMAYVAWCYGVGTGVAKDLVEAQEWSRRAYDGGSDRGLLAYAAYLVRNGQMAEAEQVYEAGWERGFVPAVYRLIRLRLRPTLPLAERLAWKPSLEWAVKAGHPAARVLLGRYLLRGRFGLRGIPRGVMLVCKNIWAIVRGPGDRLIFA